MHKSKKSDNSRGRKRKNEDQYSLAAILDDDDGSNDGGDFVEPRAAAHNAEKSDETVNEFHNVVLFL